MSKSWTFLLTALLTSVIISGCGSNEKPTEADENANATEENNVEVEDTKEEVEEAATTATSTSDFSDLIKYMEEETEGTAKVLYENKEPQVHEMDGVTLSLDAYTLVELNDFHTDFSIPFNDQTNGGVIIAQYTVKNELDKDVYYTPFLYLSFTGAEKDYNNFRDLLPPEEQLVEKLSPTNDYLLKAGETVTGYYTYPFGQDHLQDALNVSTVTVEVPAPLAVKDDFSSTIGKDGQFTLSLNDAGAEKIKANAAFYNDKVTLDDMGEKKMLKEQSGIGKSEQLGDVTVTFDGYQFTDFTPNAVEAPRFENFKTGIVLLTVKFNLDNKGSDSVSLSSMSSKLTLNDGTQYTLGEGMLLDYSYDDVIAGGQSGELLQIYLLDKEQYDKIWKNKSFEVEVGPIRNQEAKDISKGKTAIFEF
ncbi:DUF5068 domain-containing protein [Lysinibacillus telephonicus]|uniref:DUF5068 domain-containing protein n=1 Tax=Lysinibacillus telephonicus TaxID=1714840 RepID=A0A3S0HME7_9BACI|nr:DUF5068 domain-containing protein [Lysinibacillus telephonicus]RTQ93009.1 DUF5068 domain-containing protein [Lysinibacillus telephonicus]